ncbi:hypothetical protein [Methanogenium organophilum]|uniref:Uncharacterized protein n=1 Tax=Methanogenium organophilum TaxID=2199 RepID=A0A9X9T690_METOG|nr:hypothetical protein [Methanogenium organophilum]WAI00158.1 hypothetical protein OU421_06860 [Methanogenium organophilum]
MQVPVQHSIYHTSVLLLSTIALFAVVCGGVAAAVCPLSSTALLNDNSTAGIWLPGLNAPPTNEQQIYPDNSYGEHCTAEITRIFAGIIYPVMVHKSGTEERFTFISNTMPDEPGITYHRTAVFRPANSPSLSSGNASSMQNTRPTTVTTTENRDITDTAPHNSGNSSSEIAQDPWIEIDPIGTAHKNTIQVSGTTNLPDGEIIGVAAMTTMNHPSGKYSDHSHEIAETNTIVQWTDLTIGRYFCSINASLLSPGEYFIEVWPSNERYNIKTIQVFNLMPEPSPTPRPVNIIDWEHLQLPPLTVNQSMEPVLLTHAVMVVPADERTQRYEIPYGAVMLLSTDGVFRIFDSDGIQIDAFYDSHAMHITELPNDARVRHGEHITTVDIGNERILTRIYEADIV